MKRTDAQRAFFQGLPVKWGAIWQRLCPDGICRDMFHCRTRHPLIFDPNVIHDDGWEIDVGEGYRLIDIDVDEPQEGDEFWYRIDRTWVKWVPVTMFCRDRFYRRKIEEERKPEGACADEGESAINIVFDGPPSQGSGRFVEVEKDDGTSINVGEWIERPDGLWALRITHLPTEEDLS